MIEHLIITTLWIWGIHCLLSPDHEYLLHKVGDMLERNIGTWACKPLFLCPPCMSSIHGIFWGIVLYGVSFKVIVFVICLVGLNFIIKSFIYPEYEDTESN